MQLRDEFGLSKEVSIELYSQLVIIRDIQSQAYGGLVKQGCAEPLLKLLIDRTIKLSAFLKSSTALEILVYGARTNANAVGEMLLEHDCFLQQPDSFSQGTTYFNPQCLIREDDDDVPIWEHVELKEGVAMRAANLSAGEKCQIAELLDSANGPIVFKKAQVSEMLQTTLRE